MTWVDLALGVYILALGVGLSLWFGTWLWLIATVLCMIMAAMLHAWFF